MQLNVLSFSTADRVIDLLSGYRLTLAKSKPRVLDIPIEELIEELCLGIKELEDLNLIGVPFPTFFNIPIRIVNEKTHLSFKIHG